MQEVSMNRIWLKLKKLKNDLEDLNKYMASYQQNIDRVRHKLEIIHGELKTCPFRSKLVQS